MQDIKSKGILQDILLVTGSFLAAFGTVSRLEPESRVSLKLGLLLAALGSIFFVKITNLCNKALLATQCGLRFIKHFQLSISDALDITNK